MPDQKISQMDPATALTGAELVPVVQSGGNVQTTTQDIANLVSLSSLGASANGITLIGHTFAQMRADLDLEAGTDFVAYSAYSANALTLIGHTFAQMRTDLSLVPGTDVQAYDANTAKLNVAQTWSTDQTFTGLLYNRAAFAAIGVLSSTGASGYGIRFSNTGASSDSVLLQGTTNSFTGAVSIANIIPSTGAITWSGVQTFNSNLTINKNDPVLYLIDSSVGGSGLFYTNESDAHRWGRTGVAYDMTLTNDTLAVGALNITGSATLDGGAILNENDFLQLRSTSYRVLFGNDNVNVAFYKQNGSGTYISTPLNLALSDDKWTMAGALDVGGAIGLKSYTVAGLPAGSAAQIAYASNGRKNGEGAGLGTGVLVFNDGTAWRACDTGATVAA